MFNSRSGAFVPSFVCSVGEAAGAGAGAGTGAGAGAGGSPAGGAPGAAPAGGASGAAAGTSDGAGGPAGDAGSKPAEGAAPAPPPGQSDWRVPEYAGFDTWDGKVESFPEPLRPFATGLSGHYQKKLTALQEQHDAAARDRDIWRSLIDDPASTEQIEKLRGEHATALEGKAKELTALQARLAEYEQALQEQSDEHALNWYNKHQAKLKNPELKKRVISLIREGGLDPDSAMLVAEQPREVVDLAQAYMHQGVPPKHAVRLALQDAGVPFGNGRPAEEVPPVSGDAPFQASPSLAEPDIADPKVTSAAARRRAAIAAFKEVAGA
jgi:hypothetical protein